MNLLIDDSRQIQQIQDDFNMLFPFLKLELFKTTSFSRNSKSTTNNPLKCIDQTLARYRTTFNGKNIIITPEMTVHELESSFIEIYGLTPLVLRKSGNIWLETSITENWTLDEQNKQGEIITNQINGRNNR